MNILIFSRYSAQYASTRVRFNQFLPALSLAGFNVTIYPIISDATVGGLIGHKANWLTLLSSRIHSLHRVFSKLKNTKPDSLVHVHFEFFPWLPYWIEKILFKLSGHTKYSVELDDAWFHRYDNHSLASIRFLLGNKIDQVMRDATCVIAGNAYIADRARIAGARQVVVIPTVVDTAKYALSRPMPSLENARNRDKLPVIGWIGSPSTTQFLRLIESAILELHHKKIAQFVAVGADARQISGLPIEVVPWNESAEASTLYGFDIGIMPLTNSLFERGKCGYKLIQYMACGLPVVASPVGVNNTIVAHGESGYLARTSDDWVVYLTLLCQDSALRTNLGKVGLQRAADQYSLQMAAPKAVSIFQNLAANQ